MNEKGRHVSEPEKSPRAQVLFAIRRWESDYNSGDSDFFVERNYHDDAVVLFPGGSATGIEQFKRIERGVVKGAAKRCMRVDHIHWLGDSRVAVEGVVLDGDRPEFSSPYCAILSYRGDKIAMDRTYLDTASWPGIEFAAPEATPGGLGTSGDPLPPENKLPLL